MRTVEVSEHGIIDPAQFRAEVGEVLLAITAPELKDLSQALTDGVYAARSRVRYFGGRSDSSAIIDQAQSGRMASLREVVRSLIEETYFPSL